MIDITTVQPYAIPKNILQLQDVNKTLSNQNTELLKKSANLIYLLLGLIVVGGFCYRRLKHQQNEKNDIYTK